MIIKQAKELHAQLPYFKLISWDLALDFDNEVVLIEFNIRWQEINSHQISNGPLFNEYTDSVLEGIAS